MNLGQSLGKTGVVIFENGIDRGPKSGFCCEDEDWPGGDRTTVEGELMEQWCLRVAEVERGATFTERIVFIQLYLVYSISIVCQVC